jgi:hypothetical protein
MKITVRTMQHNSETKVIEVSSGLMTVGELRKKIASAFFSASESSSSSSSASLNMFLRGAALNDDDERANIKPGDTVLVNFQVEQRETIFFFELSSTNSHSESEQKRERIFQLFLAQRCSIFHRHLQHGGDSVYIGNILLVLCREDGV